MAKELGAPCELVQYLHAAGKRPVPNFSADGVAIPMEQRLAPGGW